MPILDRSEVHVDVPLTNLAIQLAVPGFVAEQIAPIVPVKKESDVYYEFNREEIRAIDDGEGDLKADGDVAGTFHWKPKGTVPYVCVKRAQKDLITDRLVANEDAPIKARQRTMNKLVLFLRTQQEIRVTKLMTDIATVAFTPAPLIWTDPSAEIEEDVKAAKEAIRSVIGVEPNMFVMGKAAENAVVDFLKATSEISIAERSRITTIPDTLWGMKTVVSGSIKDTSARGATVEALSDIWPSTIALLAWVNPSPPGLEDMSFAYILRQQAMKVRTWRDEEREASWIEPGWIQTEKLIEPRAGHLITGIL